MASPSRLKSASTLNRRKLRPSFSASCMKSHRPDLVDGLRHRQGLGLFTDQPLLRLDAQVQFQFAIDAIHTLMIPAVALDVTQVQEAHPKAPVALIVVAESASQRSARSRSTVAPGIDSRFRSPRRCCMHVESLCARD